MVIVYFGHSQYRVRTSTEALRKPRLLEVSIGSMRRGR